MLRFSNYWIALLLFVSTTLLGAESPRHFEKGTIVYVHADTGLYLRDKPGTSTNKLFKIPYGDPVVVMSPPDARHRVSVDNIAGVWLHLKHKITEGYAFSGYLSRFPVPSTNSFSAYDKVLKSFGLDALSDHNNASPVQTTDSSPSSENTLILHNAEMLDGFLVARRLLQIPVSVKYPKFDNSPSQNIDISPGKFLETQFRANGQISKITFHNAQRQTRIEAAKNNQIRIEVVYTEATGNNKENTSSPEDTEANEEE